MATKRDAAASFLSRVWIAGLIMGALVGVGVRLWTGSYPGDDAYISFRYARNLAEGNGLAFNAGEQVLGTTTPLWAVLLGVIHRITGASIPSLATIIATVADAGSCVLLGLLARRLTGSPILGIVAAVTLALAPASIEYASRGMEVSAFGFLGLAAVMMSHRVLIWPVICAIATLLRPEGVVLALALVVFVLFKESMKSALRGALLYAVLLSLPVAFPIWQFGSPIPHSMVAKSAPIYRTDPSAVMLFALFSAISLGAPSSTVRPLSAILLPVGLRRAFTCRKTLGIWLFPLLYLGLHTSQLLRGGIAFPWYLIPLLPWLVLLKMLGITHLAWLCPSRRIAQGVMVALGTAIIVSQVLSWNRGSLDQTPPTWTSVTASPLRESHYLEAARYVSDVASAGMTVAAPEIGAIGWGAPRLRILDTAWLVSPRALAYYPLPPHYAHYSSNAIPGQLLSDTRPDYILSLEIFLRPVLEQEPWVLDDYVLERSWPSDMFGSSGLWLYRRSDL